MATATTIDSVMGSPLLVRTRIGPVAAQRLTGVFWVIAQTAVAAGLAWYLTRDVLGHVEPFFAPIAAAVCLWATNVVRARLAVELMTGVALGIGLGTGVQAVLGSGLIAMAAAVLLSLCAAVVLGRGFMPERPMFVNQTTMSAILIVAFPHTGLGLERMFDALIGGGLAVVFSILLFPKNPLTVLRDARSGVLTALRDILAQIEYLTGDSALSAQGWQLTAADRLHRQLTQLTEARRTARQIARRARAGGRCATPSALPMTKLRTWRCLPAPCCTWRTSSRPRPTSVTCLPNRCAPRSATSPPPGQHSPTAIQPSAPRIPRPPATTARLGRPGS